jgi:hypothetical protein
MYVLIVTYQDPQIKYSTNIIRLSNAETVDFMCNKFLRKIDLK